MESTNEFQKSSSILREVISPTLVTYKLDYTPPPATLYVSACIYIYISYIWLVVLTILKNMKVDGKDYPIYYGKY